MHYFSMHTLIYGIEGGTQDLSGYLPGQRHLQFLPARLYCLEGGSALLFPGVGIAQWRDPDPPQQDKGRICPLSNSPHCIWHEIPGDGRPRSKPKGSGWGTPCFEAVIRIVCEQKPSGLASIFPAGRAGLEHLETFWQSSMVLDKFKWALPRQRLRDGFSGSWLDFGGLNSNSVTL